MPSNYAEFLQSKIIEDRPSGLEAIPALNPMLMDFQRDIVRWSLRRGRAALFEDCGLGKCFQSLVWAEELVRQTNKNVLILTPLAVAEQTVSEGEKFGIEVGYCRSQAQVNKGITVTNYEMLESFDPASFAGIGSEGFGAIELRRRFIGIELKESYYKTACANLAEAASVSAGNDLFSQAVEV